MLRSSINISALTVLDYRSGEGTPSTVLLDENDEALLDENDAALESD